MEKFNFLNFLANILIGMGSGILGAIVYRHLTFQNSKKVNVKICDYIIKRFKKMKDNNIPALQLKIKNISSKDLADLEVKIFGIKYYDSEKYHQNRTMIAQKHLDFLPKYDKKDKECNYFYVPSLYSNSYDIHKEIEKYDDILILIKAINYYDNNIVIQEKIIKQGNIKDHKWNFENCNCSTTKRDDIETPKSIKIPIDEIAKNCPFIQ